ncbi:uncharacterized protein EURHEDRAFT_533816 [Aspergillus ruber CBS 135680]|uniref:Uncharacterized protein n=1 Tax=Aspergillus ruber (strain CBS 135680) TaxID=1388766 RepID=A0A017S2F7_ASPRC|nr:uncharacterized protein EURHEDRAFT_533816 [Aspergillus ruber CBS 135680]EYE91223.1 hypothetical protein EURHEDRAFT_533816 [Aspergillus ruber CBS 135680]
MGNICSRSANKPDDPFTHPGRSLGSSAPSQHQHHNRAPSARVPNKQQPFKAPGRTLGGGEEEPGTGTDARTRAALAAQARADAVQSSNKGKLGTKLAAQKSMTQAQALNEASQSERAARDADGVAEARRWQ